MIRVKPKWLKDNMRRHGVPHAKALAKFAGISEPTAQTIVAGRSLGSRLDLTMLGKLGDAFGEPNPLRFLEYLPD